VRQQKLVVRDLPGEGRQAPGLISASETKIIFTACHPDPEGGG
jgi:hypothetical protein